MLSACRLFHLLLLSPALTLSMCRPFARLSVVTEHMTTSQASLEQAPGHTTLLLLHAAGARQQWSVAGAGAPCTNGLPFSWPHPLCTGRMLAGWLERRARREPGTAMETCSRGHPLEGMATQGRPPPPTHGTRVLALPTRAPLAPASSSGTSSAGDILISPVGSSLSRNRSRLQGGAGAPPSTAQAPQPQHGPGIAAGCSEEDAVALLLVAALGWRRTPQARLDHVGVLGLADARHTYRLCLERPA